MYEKIRLGLLYVIKLWELRTQSRMGFASSSSQNGLCELIFAELDFPSPHSHQLPSASGKRGGAGCLWTRRVRSLSLPEPAAPVLSETGARTSHTVFYMALHVRLQRASYSCAVATSACIRHLRGVRVPEIRTRLLTNEHSLKHNDAHVLHVCASKLETGHLHLV